MCLIALQMFMLMAAPPSTLRLLPVCHLMMFLLTLAHDDVLVVPAISTPSLTMAIALVLKDGPEPLVPVMIAGSLTWTNPLT